MPRRQRSLALLLILAAGASYAQTPSSLPADASAQIVLGGRLYQQHCALCHGTNGRDATVFPRPIWGPGHDLKKFANAKGLFDYLQLLMPFDDPAKLDDAQKTAVAAYMLMRNGSVRADASLPTGGSDVPIR